MSGVDGWAEVDLGARWSSLKLLETGAWAGESSQSAFLGATRFFVYVCPSLSGASGIRGTMSVSREGYSICRRRKPLQVHFELRIANRGSRIPAPGSRH